MKRMVGRLTSALLISCPPAYTLADIDVRWSELIGRGCAHVRNRMNF
jgi:hypothetical protein